MEDILFWILMLVLLLLAIIFISFLRASYIRLFRIRRVEGYITSILNLNTNNYMQYVDMPKHTTKVKLTISYNYNGSTYIIQTPDIEWNRSDGDSLVFQVGQSYKTFIHLKHKDEQYEWAGFWMEVLHGWLAGGALAISALLDD